MITYGLDMSLASTGFSKIDSSGFKIETIKTKSLKHGDFPNDIERIDHIVGECMSRIESPSLVCVEDFFVPMNKAQFGSAIKLIGLGTMMRKALYDAKMPFVVISPSQIKKFATGKGNCQKNMVLRDVYKKWNVEAKDDNQADAFVLAKIAESILGGKSLLKYEQQVIDACIKERPKYNFEV
jgi:crossover junction endodeoxyribonuclease RuvC